MTVLSRPARAAAALVAALAALSACSTAATNSATGPIQYWLWDSGQQPGYQKCADDFAQQNPGLTINITQVGWTEYWNKLTSGMIADTAPDVFTDHVSKFPQYADLKVLRPLDELEATRDIKDSDYQPGLAELWKGQDGHRYGSPKDWDTIAMFYDVDKVKAAGIDPAALDTLTWNPQDGGTFEKVVAHLSVDAKGVRGDEPGFDPANVKTYGLGSAGSGGDGWGQTQWSAFTGSAGWQATDKNPWGTRFNLDQPALQDTLAWYFGLVRKGYMPSYDAIGGGSGNAIGTDKQIQTGMAVLGLNGSWMISTFSKLTDAAGAKLNVAIAPTPIGPSGKRASMFNGLGDSVTTFSKQPENAAKWVKYMSGSECQKIIGESGVVFPARPEATQLAVAYNQEERGLDVSAFTDQVADKTTFLFPVTTNAADIKALMQPRFDAVYIGSSPVSSLTEVNDQLNNLFDVVR